MQVLVNWYTQTNNTFIVYLTFLHEPSISNPTLSRFKPSSSVITYKSLKKKSETSSCTIHVKVKKGNITNHMNLPDPLWEWKDPADWPSYFLQIQVLWWHKPWTNSKSITLSKTHKSRIKVSLFFDSETGFLYERITWYLDSSTKLVQNESCEYLTLQIFSNNQQRSLPLRNIANWFKNWRT
jgi:hypothetical protein